MEQINSFSKGMNKDIDPLIFNKDTYYDALNMRLISNSGTTPSLTNIKGNSRRFTMPDTTAVHRVSVVASGSTNITIQGQTGIGGSFISISDLYNYIISDSAYTYCLQNNNSVTSNSNSYSIYYNDTYLFIVGALTGTTVLTQNSLTSSVVNANLSLNSNYIPAQTRLFIIGSTSIRDTVYILSTSNITDNPGGHNPLISTDSSSVGQIWKLEYDEIDDSCTLSLLYNNYVDFSAVYPIAPSAILGRYENSEIQRIYWTDNFNKLRSFNVSNSQGFALDVTLLDVKPAINYSKPLLNNIITGGALDAGIYEAVYRLKNTNGAVTKTSPVSNIANIVSSSEQTATGGGNFSTYIGVVQGTNTGKSIIWRLEDLDLDYERVELIIMFRELLSETPTWINIVADEPIPASGTLDITFTGNEDFINLTLDDITSIDDTFTHCKTIATKDNRLFAGNIKVQKEDIDYDARAFRAKTSGGDDIYLTNNGTQSLFNSTTARASLETSDAINDYTNANAGLYKPGTSILGGSGTNISYEFGTMAVRCDSVIDLTASMVSPFRHTNPEYGISDFNLEVSKISNTGNQLHPSNSINDDIKYPFVASVLKGYERGEIYRFAITFFDKSGKPFYAKWIGDIKMPNHDDECQSGNALCEDGTLVPLSAYNGAANKDFRMSFVDPKTGIDEAFVNQLFIKFDVSIPVSISEIVSGYTISRVDRTQDNKTILGTGILNQVVSDGGTLWLPDVQVTSEGVGSDFPYLNIDGNNRAVTLNASDYTPTFECPEFILGGFPGFQTGDKLRIVTRIDTANTVDSIQVSGAGEPYIIYKYYEINTTYSGSANEYDIIQAGTVERNGTYAFSGGWNFNNYTRTDGPSGGSDAVGSRTLCVEVSSIINFATTYNCDEANGRKLLAQYVRSVSSQYGGNTYNARSNNEYISCSHFRPIDNSLTVISDSSYIFGGDVYTQVYDNQKEIKNWLSEGLGAYTGGDGGTPGGNYGKISVTQFFPCSSSHNTDLRHGLHMNKDLSVDDGSGASGYETYDYNSVYSNIGNIKKYFTRPSQTSDIEEYDNRVWASELKENGELVDSWGIFLVDNKWDVEGSYGPINGLEILQDKMFVFQDNSFGVLSINPRVLVTDASNASIQLGTGNVIQRHDYISTENGTKHQWSIIKSPSSLIWWDSNVRKLMRFSNGLSQLSDIKGMRGYLNSNTDNLIKIYDNPIYISDLGVEGIGVHGVYDFKNNEFLITFRGGSILNGGTGESNVFLPNKFTLIFNEEVDAFTSFTSFTPNVYITNHREIYSPDSARQASVYLHEKGEYCNFYDSVEESKTTVIVNPNPQYTKVFDNLEWITDTLDTSDVNISQDTWNSIRVRNTYQNTDTRTLTLNSNVKRKDRGFRFAIPRNRVLYTTQNADIYNDLSLTDKPYGERIRDKYSFIDFTYNNTDNYSFTFKLLNTLFRPSAR